MLTSKNSKNINRVLVMIKMRALSKIILFGMVLAPLVFTCGSFPYITDTFASFSDTKHVDATLTAAVWDTQANVVGLSDINLNGSGEQLQGIILGTRGNPDTEAIDKNSSGGNFSNIGNSADNSANNYSAAGNYTSNQTANSLNANNLTANNLTANNLTTKNGNHMSSSGSKMVPEQTSTVLPVANFSTNITSGYAPLSVQFTDLSENSSEWNWDFGDGVASTEQNPTHIYSTEGNYNVNLIATNENDTHLKLGIITVLGKSAVVLLPVANFSTDVTSGYAPLAVEFTDLSENLSEWNWDFENDGKIDSVNKTPVYTYSVPGDYIVNLTVSNANGTDSKFVIITVLEIPIFPVANFSSNVTSGYSPLTVQFADISTNATGWSWDFGNGANSTEQSPEHVYATPGTYIVNYTVNLTVSNRNGTDSKTSIITILQKPEPMYPVANFSTNVTSGYTPLAVEFTDLSENSTEWNWDFENDGQIDSVNKTPVYVYAAPGNYTVNLTTINANGTDSKSAMMTVLEKPIFPEANFSTNITSGYAPLSVQFTDLSKNVTRWNWDFVDGNTSTLKNPANTYFVAGNYTVNLTANNSNGTDSKLAIITVFEKSIFPVADSVAT